jgi:hypothetical protein
MWKHFEPLFPATIVESAQLARKIRVGVAVRHCPLICDECYSGAAAFIRLHAARSLAPVAAAPPALNAALGPSGWNSAVADPRRDQRVHPVRDLVTSAPRQLGGEGW